MAEPQKKNPANLWPGEDVPAVTDDRPASPAEYYAQMFPQNTKQADEQEKPSKS